MIVVGSSRVLHASVGPGRSMILTAAPTPAPAPAPAPSPAANVDMNPSPVTHEPTPIPPIADPIVEIQPTLIENIPIDNINSVVNDGGIEMESITTTTTTTSGDSPGNLNLSHNPDPAPNHNHTHNSNDTINPNCSPESQTFITVPVGPVPDEYGEGGSTIVTGQGSTPMETS